MLRIRPTKNEPNPDLLIMKFILNPGSGSDQDTQIRNPGLTLLKISCIHRTLIYIIYILFCYNERHDKTATPIV